MRGMRLDTMEVGIVQNLWHDHLLTRVHQACGPDGLYKC